VFRSKALRPIAGIVLVTFSALTLQPLTAAAQLPPAPKRAQSQPASGEERFSRTLKEIHEILKEVVPQSAMPHRSRGSTPEAAGKPGEKVLQAVGPKLRLESEGAKPSPGIDIAAKVKSLRGKYKELKSLEGEVTKGFKETEKHIRDKNLPPEILARQEAAVAEYDRRKSEFTALMDAVEAADDGKGSLASALTSLGEFMAKYPNEKTHTPTDPNNLPWGSPKPVTRAPYTSPSQFKTSRLFGEPVKVAQAGSLSGIGLPTTILPVAPTPADTAPTEDVQITQAIRDLATSLNNNPVQIYNWVRNNIAFIPSYGSIQGSDMTLQTKRGNSFDTASLLIALLRVANIPSRYVYGTIEVPADKAMNWVGGVTVPQAAMSLMGQGGIPVIGVAQGGQVTAIRLEHVWVEAYVDYIPSRGAVNRNPNTWVPMDASFKQYQFTQGMDIKTNVSFDANTFLTQIQQGAIVNETEGWVQNASRSLIQQTSDNYATQIFTYANAQNPNATVGDVLGKRNIAQASGPILLGTLPYKALATGAKFQTIPDNLRWKFRYNVYASDMDRAMDSPFIAYSGNTVSVAQKKITLSSRPATAADQSTINSFLPAPHPDGSPIQPGEMPTSLPGYLIHLVPDLRVDGQVVASGPAFTMGSELVQVAGYFNPATGQWEDSADNRPISGDYVATALNLQGISAGQSNKLQSDMNNVKSRLTQAMANPTDPAPLQGLTKDDFSGNVLYAGILSYMGAIDVAAQTTARTADVVTMRMPSFGNFGTLTSPRFTFGVPRSVLFSGVAMDVDRIVGAEVAKDNSSLKVVSFRRSVGGQYSALEHQIPEDLFTDPNDPNRPQAFSAVKAIGVAGTLGQRIYTLDATNFPSYASILAPLAIPQDVKTEILDALTAGKVVTFHESKLVSGGFSGVGYIILDPDTGAGAYKISGGVNGGDLILTILALIVIVSLMAIEFVAIFVGFALGAWLAFGAALLVAYIIESTYDVDPMALSIAKLIAATILTLGVGSMLGAITTISKLLEVFASFVASLLVLLYKIVTGVISRIFSFVPVRETMFARLMDLRQRRVAAT
jgi:transglutaminase-like putative cysteine protease